MKYYYFAASLPMISLGKPPPISIDEFRNRCEDQLAAADRTAATLITGADLTSDLPAHPAFLKRLEALEIQIRNAVAARRSSAADQQAGQSLMKREHPGFRLDIEQAVDSAFSAATPLDRERILDSLRWRLYEELGGTDPFSRDAVLAYAARLRLSERWARLLPENGADQFRQTIERIATRQGNETP